MEWFDLVKEYEEKNGSFANASYDNPDYVKFRVKMIMLETDFDIYDAVAELAGQVANPGDKHMSRRKAYKLQQQYEREFLDVLYIV
jgi:hypothetical protein